MRMEHVSVHGEEIPALGFGTYRLRGRNCTETVERALRHGYRHIDTAEYYDNHAEVGEAIASSDVDREEIFLTTKVWRSNLKHDDVLRSANSSLTQLGVEYVDLLLIHWPSPNVPISETIAAMNQLQTEGTVRHIGVSNFSIDQLREAMSVSDTPIVTNQVKYHPFNTQPELLEFCIENDVMLTAYSPLAQGSVADTDALREIGDRYGKSAAQVALRWLLQQERVSAIPKASSREHLVENFDVFDFELTDEEMADIFELRGGLFPRLRRKLGL